MYPYPRHVSDDEPTMTDVRGVLPGQRPPIDPAVLDEPTSEVPVIRPWSEETSDAAPEAAAEQPDALEQPDPVEDAEAFAEPDAAAVGADVTEAEPTDVDGQDESQPEAVTEPDGSVEPDEAQQEVAEPEVEAVPDPAASVATEPESVPETTGDDLAAEDSWAAESALETPDVPAAEAEPEEAVEPEAPAEPLGHPISEMSKMAWSPIPAAPLAESAPEPVAESEPAEYVEAEIVEPEVVEPDVAEAEIAEAEIVEPDVAEEPLAKETDAEAAETSEVAGEPEPVVAHRPGEVAETHIALWSEDAADRMRTQWRELQLQFMDDPEAAVAGAKSLVTNAVDELARTLLAAQDELNPYRETDRVDTETMRVAMRQYREFLDRVLAL